MGRPFLPGTLGTPMMWQPGDSLGLTFRALLGHDVNGSAFQNGPHTLMVEPCARHDSNMRPLPPQGSALSPELRARGGQV